VNQKFSKSLRLRNKTDYNSALKGSFLVETPSFLLSVKKRCTTSRLGITVTKKYGKAHDRNRFKRVVRDVFRRMWNEIPPMDLVVRPKKKLESITSASCEKEIKQALIFKEFPKTWIVRHRRENQKKCTLTALEKRLDLSFYEYPLKAPLPDQSNYILLSFDGPEISKEDADKGVILLDGTWRYAEVMESVVDKNIQVRSLPKNIVTAYPRRQEDCSDQSRGLASVEALYVAYKMLGRSTAGLLDHYYWRNLFLEQNPQLKEYE
jgi:pre-rRNA-processing protein TSR3